MYDPGNNIFDKPTSCPNLRGQYVQRRKIYAPKGYSQRIQRKGAPATACTYLLSSVTNVKALDRTQNLPFHLSSTRLRQAV